MIDMLVHPINHYSIIVDNDDKRKGDVIIDAMIRVNHIRALDGKWQYGRATDGRRTVNFLGFAIGDNK